MLSCPLSQPAGEGEVNNWDTHKLQSLQDVVAIVPELARGAEAISQSHRHGTDILTGKRYMLCIVCDGSRQKSSARVKASQLLWPENLLHIAVIYNDLLTFYEYSSISSLFSVIQFLCITLTSVIHTI